MNSKWINPKALAQRVAECDASLRELADLAGVEPSTISRIQAGKFENPKQETLRKVDKAVKTWNRKRRAKALERAMA